MAPARLIGGSPGTGTGSITDIDGIQVGHASRTQRGWRTGTTVVVVPDGAVAGVDVRGGGPGTRETDLLRPENLIQQVHAVCLTGGSAYGLSAASGVMAELEQRRIGFPVGADGLDVVPIVPAAVIYDLGRGGVFANRPDEAMGRAATSASRSRPVTCGAVGAGTGAVAGGLQGGIGSASLELADGTVVAALAVVNSAGSVIDPATGRPWEESGRRFARPRPSELVALRAALTPRSIPLNTTIGVVATTADLSKAECTKFAGVAHDGMARAIRPAHSMFDGDTVFALSTGRTALPAGPVRTRAVALNAVLEAGAQCFATACVAAVLTARSHRGGPPSYRDLCPSLFATADDNRRGRRP